MPEQKKTKIWISAGEISGDLHGAALVKELWRADPGLELVGMGGPQMRAARADGGAASGAADGAANGAAGSAVNAGPGQPDAAGESGAAERCGFKSFFQVEQLSVMGFTEVFAHIPEILRLLRGISRKLEEERPDAVVVIDAPDFHFRVIKAARRLGIPVYYYISPKLWAWRQGRARFIRKNVRRLLSILPFEVDFYKTFGMSVDYVGNPVMDALNLPELDRMETQKGLVGFMPGSRKKEVSSLMPEFGKAARIMLEKMPELRFACAVAPGMSEEYLKSFWPGDVPLEFCPSEDRYGFMRRCEMLVSASGTAVLESALVGTPTLIAYKVSPLTFSLGRRLVKISFVGLPNLIAGREVLPELLQEAADGPNLARRALEWLDPDEGAGRVAKVRRDLAVLRKMVGEQGATERAAKVILADLRGCSGENA